jgi:hypothetical protein
MSNASLPLLPRRILSLYEQAVFQLPIEKVGHFFYRVYAVTKEEKYLNMLAYAIQLTKPQRFQYARQQFDTNHFVYRRDWMPKKITPRVRQRIRLYQKMPQLQLYDEIVNDIFFLHQYGLQKVFQQDIDAILSHCTPQKMRELYLSEEVIRYDNSFAVNITFYLQHLGHVPNVHTELISQLRNIYMDSNGALKRTLTDPEYASLIYSLTHIIIAASHYYGRFVSEQKWIIDFFVQELDTIMQRTTVDIIAEVALCFQLTRTTKRHASPYQTLMRFLRKQSVILTDQTDIDFLIEKEHTNSLLFILFSEPKRLYGGPNLAKHPLFTNRNIV